MELHCTTFSYFDSILEKIKELEKKKKKTDLFVGEKLPLQNMLSGPVY